MIVPIIILMIIIAGTLTDYLRKRTDKTIQVYPINTIIKVHVNLELLNKNYRILNKGLRYILEQNIEEGFIKRKPGNIIVFFEKDPTKTQTDEPYTHKKDFEYGTAISPKSTRFVWIFCLIYFEK